MRTIVALALFSALASAGAQDTEHPQLMRSSKAFQHSAASSIQVLQQSGFENALDSPGARSNTEDILQIMMTDISSERPIPDVGPGQRGVTYDVILQPGHYGRVQGAVGTKGHYVSERAIVAFVTNVVAQSLRRRGLSVLVVSADNFLKATPGAPKFDGLRAQVFLAIHADGSTHPCSGGPSLGYQSSSSLLGMHAVAWGLASALGYDYSDFRRDNFTANEAQYYMFKRVRAERLTGLLEIGELTCPSAERKLITSSKLIGLNIARSLDYIVQMPRQ